MNSLLMRPRTFIFLIIILIVLTFGFQFLNKKSTLGLIVHCLPNQYTCYESYYSNLVTTKGVTAALDDIKSRYRLDPYVKSRCHVLMHVIGRSAVNSFKTVSEAFSQGDSFCWSGYYHGVMESIVELNGIQNLSAQLNSICANIPGKEYYSFDYYNCVHGLGHGIMAVTNDELFDSLKICDALNGSWEQSSCYGGVFMENIITDGRNHKTSYLKADDLFYPCTAVAERYKAACYMIQPSHAIDSTDEDFSKVFLLCSQNSMYADICYQSIGRDASGETYGKVEQTGRICLLGKDFEQQSNCVIGAVKDLIYYYHSTSEAFRFCSSLPLDLQGVCFPLINATSAQL